jgi:hypothetical protein
MRSHFSSSITGTWARHGRHRDRRDPLICAFRGRLPLTGKLPTGDPLTAVVIYPETVYLARVLADLRWRYPRPGITSFAIGEFTRAVNRTLGIGYSHVTEPYDGLYHWLQTRYVLVDPDHQQRVRALLRAAKVEAAPAAPEIPHSEIEPLAAEDNSPMSGERPGE